MLPCRAGERERHSPDVAWIEIDGKVLLLLLQTRNFFEHGRPPSFSSPSCLMSSPWGPMWKGEKLAKRRVYLSGSIEFFCGIQVSRARCPSVRSSMFLRRFYRIATENEASFARPRREGGPLMYFAKLDNSLTPPRGERPASSAVFA